MIRAYVFDLDGTLVDSEILWVEAAEVLMRDAGCPISHEEALAIVYGRSWHDIYDDVQRLCPHLSMPIESLASELEKRFIPLRDSRDIRIPGSISLLKRLSGEYPVAIVSGSYAKDIEHAIELMGIAKNVTFFLGTEHFSPGKPDPACYRMAASRFGLPPEECLAFEDSAAGIAAATGAGLHCVALVRPGRPKQDVSSADWVLDDLSGFSVARYIEVTRSENAR